MTRKTRDETLLSRQFGAALAALLLALAAFAAWRGHAGRTALLATVAALPPLLALAAPGAWLALFRRWMRVAHAISSVVTFLVLVTFFYGLLTPFCAALRLFGVARRDRSWRDGRASYWIPRGAVPATLERYRKSY